MNGTRYAQVSGWGMSVPERVVTNADLSRIVDTDDEWIVSHSGIRERHIVHGDRESTATLATRAGRNALMTAGLLPGEVDLIIVATATPEYAFPSTASCVQDALGAANAGAFDLSAGCSGFLYALSMGSQAIRAGGAQNVLVIGAETLSKITDWTDRNTCVLFADGAGALVLSGCDQPCGVLGTVLGSDGSGGELLMLPAGGSHCPASIESVSNGDHFIKMNGREVFRFATQVMAKATEDVMQKVGWQPADVKLVVPHQANVRIINSAAKRLNMPQERFLVNIDRYGNTSSASIPIALCEAIHDGRIQSGDKLVLVAFGAGLTWASAALTWGTPTPERPRRPWQRAAANAQFGLAAVRSLGLRASRRAYTAALGPEGQDGPRGRLRERIDRWRRRNKK